MEEGREDKVQLLVFSPLKKKFGAFYSEKVFFKEIFSSGT